MSQTTSHKAAHPMAGITGRRESARRIARAAEHAAPTSTGHVSTTACEAQRWKRPTRRAAKQLHLPYAPPPAGKDLWVAEGTPPRFVVTCKQCGRQLMVVDRIRDPEIAILEGHLRACCQSEPLGDTPPLGEVMRGLRVSALEQA